MDNIFTRIPKFRLEEIIKESNSVSEVFRKLELSKSGDQYTTFKDTVKSLNLSISHFKSSFNNDVRKEIPIEKIFISNSFHGSHTLIRKIKKYKLIPYECSKCKNQGMWLNESLSLQLDHLDGDNQNNELSNLRFLCPNCHTQTPTYRGKNLKRKYFCQTCGDPVKKKRTINCRSCSIKKQIKNGAPRVTLVNWPNDDTLSKLLWEKPPEEICKELNCSTNGLKKHCIKNNILRPPVGYWIRRKNGHNHEASLNKILKNHKPMRVYSQLEIDDILKMYSEGISLRKIAKQLNTTHMTVKRLIELNKM